MTTNREERLGKYRRPGQGPQPPKEQAAPAPDGLQPYQAFQLSDSERRYLQIRPKFPDPAECPLNAMITSISGEWRMGMAVTIEYAGKMVIKIRGENLTPLFEALLNWKVEWLAEFDPQEHTQPDDGKEPFIKTIEIVTTRPEPPPPMGQRH